MEGPLSGTRVIALSHAQAGPYGSMLLADMGAEVIKIEPPGGEMGRAFGGPSHNGESYYFLAYNRGKKSLVLDIGTELGRQALHDLVRVSDVVWDNYRTGAMKRLGADYDTLKGINPRVICSSISAFGSKGPYRDLPAYDIVAQGMSGIMSVTGEPEGPPLRAGPAIADFTTGLFAAMGVCAAIAERAKTGKGRKIEVSLLDSCISLMSYHLSHYFCSGEVPGRLGSGHLSLIPYGCYKTRDGYITIGISWPRVARTLGLDWMIGDQRFSTREARWQNRGELERAFSERLLEATSEEWLNLLRKDDIAAGRVNSVDEVVADPQVEANDIMLTVNHSLGGQIRLAGNPIKMPGSMYGVPASPPTLGQHNDEILQGLLGYSERNIVDLRKQEQEHAASLQAHLHKLQ
ncbi:MAG: CoA transferase [Chloroflexi bacterium]|nr:CoA transferase [Chloroflexota bacterium]